MKTTHYISNYALLACLVGIMPYSADAAIRVSNKAATYTKMNTTNNSGTSDVVYQEQRPSVMPASSEYIEPQNEETPEDLPVRVANVDLARKILRGDTNSPVSRDDLSRCSMVIPTGNFEWGPSDLGAQASSASTCVAVVEMRAYQAAKDGSDLVVARARVNAGDRFKCNISAFPESSYTENVGSIEFPADRAPTMEEVVSVMNQEQKQNAGFKIVAGALLGGVGGNMTGKNDIGKEGMFGASKDKVKNTAIGAVLGSAVGAAGAYTGKVAGDTIMSAGVNAAAGGIIGNVMASGNDVLRIETCKEGSNGSSFKCLIGYLQKSVDMDTDADYYYDTEGNSVYECKDTTSTNGNITLGKKCDYVNMLDFRLDCPQQAEKKKDKAIANEQGADSSSAAGIKYEDARKNGFNGCKKYARNSTNLTIDESIDGKWIKVVDGKKAAASKTPAAIKFSESDKMFGWSSQAWEAYKVKNGDLKVEYKHLGNGKVEALSGDDKKGEEYKLANFYPIFQGVDDGGVVDLSNKARAKSTMIGAGAGGALGAFSAYQGAQGDVQERYVAAETEYRDSLSKVFCATGKRFLGRYNEEIDIPALNPADDNK